MKIYGIICPACGDTVYSRANHDYRSCTCKLVAVDGGQAPGGCARIAYDPAKINPPQTTSFELPVSLNDLYRDWNYSLNKYGLIRRAAGHPALKNARCVLKMVEKKAPNTGDMKGKPSATAGKVIQALKDLGYSVTYKEEFIDVAGLPVHNKWVVKLYCDATFTHHGMHEAGSLTHALRKAYKAAAERERLIKQVQRAAHATTKYPKAVLDQHNQIAFLTKPIDFNRFR